MAKLNAKKSLTVNGKNYQYFSLPAIQEWSGKDISRLPNSLKVLLENLARHLDGIVVNEGDVKAVVDWLDSKKSDQEINFHPARVLMQDFTGVPAVVDLAAMREAVQKLGGNTQKINPLTQVDLVIDHSVSVDEYGAKDSFKKNVELEFERNGERYSFLRWGQKAFNNFRVVPPGTGICHQVNVEYLAQVVWTGEKSGEVFAYPDTLVGTDSHTTMVNGLSVLGWGVGGIEAEAAMLGQAVTMLIPEVVGVKLKGKLKEGATATDVVLTVTHHLRKKGVVGKFVEFYGTGLDSLSLADRATLANMAPEYGATCGFFPIDQETINYLRFTGRDENRIALVEAYAKAQGMWRTANSPDPIFTDILEIDLSTIETCLAGPKRPQDQVVLKDVTQSMKKALVELKVNDGVQATVEGKDYKLKNGDVVIAAITSCTNTSNPSVLIAAGLVARKARKLGLTVKPWVKTSLAPGSQVVTDYLIESGLQEDLDAMGFNLVGYGCTTCIGNSGPLPTHIANAVDKENLVVASVLSGNRNFEGRVNPHVKANYLASPPLVVAYALAGSLLIDVTKDPIGKNAQGKEVFFKDVWPSHQEILETMNKALKPEMFKSRYASVFEGPKEWQSIKTSTGATYSWEEDSTYIKHPPYFENMTKTPAPLTDIKGAKVLALLGDSVTTDHISPAGSIAAHSPAGVYLKSKGIDKQDFNSYGARRGNHEVMMRGTFANIRIKNEMLGGKEGGNAIFIPTGKEMSIYDAAMEYKKTKTPLVVIAGKEYGTGSSRDWAAKGTMLLGIRAVVAESFERIHRSNLIGMGILPLEFKNGESRHTLKLTGKETFSILGATKINPRMDLDCEMIREDGSKQMIKVRCRIDTLNEVEYYKHGGILHYVLRSMVN